jgi:hypothetical protein
MPSLVKFAGCVCILALVVVPVSAQTQPAAPISAQAQPAASSDARATFTLESRPATSINAAVSREARRAASEAVPAAQQAPQQKQSSPSRHTGLLLFIVTALFIGMIVIADSAFSG